MTKDRRLISMDELQELEDLEGTFQPKTINISDPKVAKSFTDFAKQNDPEGFKKFKRQQMILIIKIFQKTLMSKTENQMQKVV